MKFNQIVVAVVLLAFSYVKATENMGATSNKKNHLEDLFIWKVSEELKLSTTDEKKFTEVVRNLNLKKQKLTQKLDEVTNHLIHAKVDSERKSYFETYKKTLKEYNQLSVTELDQMHAILGTQKLARYIEVKLELTNKVKSLMLSPEKNTHDKKPLPAPQVIEEP